MAASLDDPAYWRDQAFESEAVGDLNGAIHFWQAAIAAKKRQAAVADLEPDLEWLRSRLARARSAVEFTKANPEAKKIN